MTFLPLVAVSEGTDLIETDIETSNCDQSHDLISSAKPDIVAGTFLSPLYFVFKDGSLFMDKKLPTLCSFSENPDFGSDYFLSLYTQISSFNSFNYNGARIKLAHSKINVDKFRELLPSCFTDIGLLQYLEYGL